MALTPMMQQYLQMREKYKDCILFYRIGDFYEMFYDQAKLCSRELELTLTGKDCGESERAPMCGIPYHAVNTYIPKLVEKGYKVAICEQVENPKEAKGLVKRDVIKIITPGTITELTMLDEKKNNYIASIIVSKENFSFCYCDISTGEFYISSIKSSDRDIKLINEIAKVVPSEIVVKEDKLSKIYLDELSKTFPDIYISKFNNDSENSLLKELCSKDNVELSHFEVEAASLLLNYIEETQKDAANQVNKITYYNIEKYMQLDTSSRKNLEITESNREKTKRGSLLWVLDKTSTAMGGRKIRKWLEAPLINKEEILLRQNGVESFYQNNMLRDEMVEALKTVYDMERLISKVVNSSANSRELVSLKNSLKKIPYIKNILLEEVERNMDQNSYISKLYEDLDELQDVYDLINKSIVEDGPITIKEGNIIKPEYNEEVSRYKNVSVNGQNLIMQLEAKERELTNIPKLKIGYNHVFGYYIEVTNSYKNLIPEDRYIRKQTLAGSERYITEELKKLEEDILGAKEKLIDLEYKIFCEIRKKIASQVIRVQKSADVIATLDVLCSLAQVAEENSYVKPEFNDEGTIEIVGGRHAVVEKALGVGNFVPNDVTLNNDKDRFLIITGPNMAGKSTYMRQVAIISYMAQIGSFVPADSAKVSIVDRIFTRIGASDDLAMGESTFMVEMRELANILENATKNSLIILDEIGRGTSTYDGLAIAWATAEYVASKEKIGAKTLFATHYHELIELEGKIDGVKNYSVDVIEKGDDVVFLRKIKRGGADESYGIYVAKLAGVKSGVIKRAGEILHELEDVDLAKKTIREKKKNITTDEIQVDMFNYKMAEVSKILQKTNLDELAPKEALDVLYKLKEKLN